MALSFPVPLFNGELGTGNEKPSISKKHPGKIRLLNLIVPAFIQKRFLKLCDADALYKRRDVGGLLAADQDFPSRKLLFQVAADLGYKTRDDEFAGFNLLFQFDFTDELCDRFSRELARGPGRQNGLSLAVADYKMC